MSAPSTHPEILAALAASGADVAECFAAVPAAAFFTGDPAHWGPAYHLGHLTLTHARIGAGFRAATRLPQHPTGRSRTFDEIRAAYLEGLAGAPPAFIANNPFTPTLEPGQDAAALLAAFAAADQRLRDGVASWSEAELDARALEHPVLGTMTAREMLFFCLAHDRHHLEGVRRQFATGS